MEEIFGYLEDVVEEVLGKSDLRDAVLNTSLDDQIKYMNEAATDLLSKSLDEYDADITDEMRPYVDNFYDFMSNLTIKDIKFHVKSIHSKSKGGACEIWANQGSKYTYFLKDLKGLKPLITSLVRNNSVSRLLKYEDTAELVNAANQLSSYFEETDQKVDDFIRKNTLLCSVFVNDIEKGEKMREIYNGQQNTLHRYYRLFLRSFSIEADKIKWKVGDRVFFNKKGGQGTITEVMSKNKQLKVKTDNNAYVTITTAAAVRNKKLTDPFVLDTLEKLKKLGIYIDSIFCRA